MNPITCKSDNIDGDISITESTSSTSSLSTTTVDFIVNSSSNSTSSTSWSFEIQNVLQLMVSKKAPFTSAKIVFKTSSSSSKDENNNNNNSLSKILIFNSSEDRTNFVNAVERCKKDQEEREQQKQRPQAKTKKEALTQEDAAVDVDEDENDDVDEEVRIISVRRKAWLDNDDMSSKVFQLLSQVSAFGNQKKEKKNAKNAKNVKEQEEVNDEETGEDDLTIFDSILQEEEQKYYSHPDRQEIGSASVYDALNSIVDPSTQTLKPISQAVAAGIFKQIPHLAAVYTRVVHSAEDEMLFWVSVVRRRLFFSRTKLDAELAECGSLLCPLTTATTKTTAASKSTTANQNQNETSGSSLFLLEELDLQEQRPKTDQMREHQQQNQQQKKKTNNVSALLSELNFASGKCVDDLVLAQQQKQKHEDEEQKNINDDDQARVLQFGAMSNAEKMEAISLLNKRNEQENKTGTHDDSRRRQREEESIDQNNKQQYTNMMVNSQKLAKAVAQQLLQTSSTSSKQQQQAHSDDHSSWQVVFVGKTPFQMEEVEHHHQQLFQSVTTHGNQNVDLKTSAFNKNSNNHHHQHDSLSLLRHVGTNSNFVHGRAAAYLVRIFWRKARETFELIQQKNEGNKKKNSSSNNNNHINKKLESSLTRLNGIRQSLVNVLKQWKVSSTTKEEEKDSLDQKEKNQWSDALEQIEQVVELISSKK